MLQIRRDRLPDPEDLQGWRGDRWLRWSQGSRHVSGFLLKRVVTFSFSASSSPSSFALLLLSVDGIVNYFKKQVGPASVELEDEEQLQKFISDMDASIVGELLPDSSVINF